MSFENVDDDEDNDDDGQQMPAYTICLPISLLLNWAEKGFCCGSLLFLLSVFILWFIYYVSDIFCKF